MKRVSSSLWLVLSVCIAFSSAKTLCSRIFLQNINEETMPYKMIEGVYVKEDKTHNNFPLYKRENDNLVLYLYTGKNAKNYLVFGLGVLDHFGIAATLYSYVDPTFWLSSGILDREDVFQGLISQWMYLNTREQIYDYVSSSSFSTKIKAVCVDEDFRECNSDRVYLNKTFNDGKGNVLTNSSQDYFRRRQGVFRNLRPVYEHSRSLMYLQYVDDYWVVTSQYWPSGYNVGTYMRVKDLALRPEYITKTWSVHYNGVWSDMADVRVLCRGVTSMKNTCASRPCYSNANCVYTSGNETLCLCPPGYTGVTCATNTQCPTPSPLANTELNFAYPGRRPGYLGMSFCSSTYPSVRFSLCVIRSFSPFWSRQGQACRAGTTNSPRWTLHSTRFPRIPPRRTRWRPNPTASSINFDDIPYILPVVLTGAVLLQFLLAFVIYFCAKCVVGCKESKEEQNDLTRQQEVGEELGRRLEQVAGAGSQEELDRNIQEYQDAVQNFQDENDEKEVNRKRGFYRNASLWRLISMQMYFSFYLWLIYFAGCGISQCTRYALVFEILRTFAIVMLCISPVVVIIESFFSHELSYLSNILQDQTAWSYIKEMHEVPPQIVMIVECYHYETRVRVVYYTDSNGNTQSRTETYTEKVTTFIDQDEFSFGSWVDVSKREMPPIGHSSLTRLKIDPCILFGDQETADEYASQVAAMIERNRHRDVHTDYSAKRQIPGLKKRISTYVDLNVRPWWIRTGYFWLATLLMMTWPYRWLFRAKTGKTYYILKKKMYKSTTPPTEVDITDPIAVLSNNAPFFVGPCAANNQSSDPMTEVGAMNTSFQNYPPPYPAVDTSAGQPSSAGPHPSAPHLVHGLGAPHPQVHDLSAVGPVQFPSPAASAAYVPHPSGSALPPFCSGPAVSPSYEARPVPEAPPPSYEESVG